MIDINDYDAGSTDENPLNSFWMEGDSLAPPCQADMDVVDSILDFAKPNSDSCLYDLGCGDGRICIRATQRFGCKSVGCEIEEKLVLRFQKFIGLLCETERSKISLIHGDLLEINFSSAATIIVIYLLPDAVELIKLKLIESLRNGAILVCNTWGPKGLMPVSKIACGYCQNVNLFKYDKSSIPDNFPS